MSTVNDLCRGHKRLRPLIEFALSEGWDVSRTAGAPALRETRLAADPHRVYGERPSGHPERLGMSSPGRTNPTWRA